VASTVAGNLFVRWMGEVVGEEEARHSKRVRVEDGVSCILCRLLGFEWNFRGL
jgi:hypothetical protein